MLVRLMEKQINGKCNALLAFDFLADDYILTTFPPAQIQ